jgi:hypothetical protein
MFSYKKIFGPSLIAIIAPFISLAAESVLNEANYKLISPLPGGTDTVTGFTDYASFFFPFLLSFAAIAALVVFVIGSIRYITGAVSPSQTEAARGQITNALLGLLIAVGSVLILGTINPQLLELKLNLDPVGQCEECTDPLFVGVGDYSDNYKECSNEDECSSKLCLLDTRLFSGDNRQKCFPSALPINSYCATGVQCLTERCGGYSPYSSPTCLPSIPEGGLPVNAICDRNSECASGDCCGFLCLNFGVSRCDED